MIEIKFRAWDKEKSRMLSVSIEGMDGGLMPVNGDWDDTIRPFDDEDCILMQYTGLKDKNGKEIYESDIVKTHETRRPQVIYWHDDCASYRLGYNGKETQFDKTYSIIFSSQWEVIGNIYENGNLLKERLNEHTK